jgi:phosphoribosylamine--glycine ligase
VKRVLVVGGGGREHAIVRALLRSPQRPELLATPGIPCLDVGAEDVDGIVRAAVDERVDLVVVGPEAPLVAGLVDALADEGIAAFGPSAAAARIEGSKTYAKELMRDVRVPTASYMVLRSREEAEAQLPCASYPAVLKADVLAAGKGVIICANEAEAREAVETFFGERRFGKTEVVLEEFLEGEELSLLALCDGERAVPMAPAQDYKRIFDGDQGPNTGGMGSYSPVPGIDREHTRALALALHQPVIDELRRRGTPYHGVLYAGLMMTADGPKVLEYNCRFGDPETQAILPRLRSDLLDLLERSTRPGGLEGVTIEWSPEWAVTIVLASRGYPESSSKGDLISGVRSIDSIHTELLHAGTAERDGELVTAGGRVLNVTALGADPARDRGDRGRGPRERLRGRRPDRVRRQAAAARHRRAGGGAHMTEGGQARGAIAETETQVEDQFAELDVDSPLVGIVMGSKSDMPTMEKAAQELEERGIRNEIRVMSAHRDPDTVAEYAKNARMRGLRVIIAGAGLAAALPGVVAAHTELPVIGVPLTSSSSVAGGLDALLAIAQMPPGVPVACVGVNNARNAAVLAARIIQA